MYINQLTTNNTLLHMHSLGDIQKKTVETIASGKRINRASDDAAGTAIESRMSKYINGLRQGTRNASDADAMLQVFENSLSVIQDLLQRGRELAMQSSNGTYSAEDRANMNVEFQNLADEIDRISNSTKYNGNTFFSVANTSVDIVLSDIEGDTLTINFKKVDKETLIGSTSSLLSKTDAEDVLAKIKDGIEYVTNLKGDFASYMSRLATHIGDADNIRMNISDVRSRIADADVAESISELSKQEILQSASLSTFSKAMHVPKNIVNLLY